MVDIHSHFLYGIDDGAKDLSQSTQMLQQAAEVGITDLTSTPHFNEFIGPHYTSRINTIFNELKEFISEKKLNLEIYSASEVLLDSKIIDWVNYKNFLHGKEKNYLLFELPHFFEMSKISKTIFDLKLNNITPILAHPERSIKIQESPEILIQWVNQGCVMQMNAGSIMGQFGKRCKTTSEKFISSGVIHLFASDAHEPKHRNFETLKNAKEYINNNYDEEFADILFNLNPSNILNSKPVKFFKTNSESLKSTRLKYFISKFRKGSQN